MIKKRRPKKKPSPLGDLLGALFNAILDDVKHYPPPEKTKAIDFFAHTDDMWRKTISLCHPDKHDNSPLSTEVTQWLIKNRPKKTS